MDLQRYEMIKEGEEAVDEGHLWQTKDEVVNGPRTTWWSLTPGCRRADGGWRRNKPKWLGLPKIWSLQFFWLIGMLYACSDCPSWCQRWGPFFFGSGDTGRMHWSVPPAWSSVNQIAAATPCSS